MVVLWAYGNENGIRVPGGWSDIDPDTWFGFPGGIVIDNPTEYPVEGSRSVRLTQNTAYQWGGPARVIDPAGLTQYPRVNFRSYFRATAQALVAGVTFWIVTVPMNSSGAPTPYSSGGRHRDLLEVDVRATGVTLITWRNTDPTGSGSGTTYQFVTAPMTVLPDTDYCIEMEYDSVSRTAGLYFSQMGQASNPRILSLPLPSGWVAAGTDGSPPPAGTVALTQYGVSAAPPAPNVRWFDAHVVADIYIGPLAGPPVGDLHVTVLEDSTPVSGATVLVLGPDVSGVTDAGGVVDFTGLAEDSYTVRTTHPVPYWPQQDSPVIIVGGQTTNLTVVFQQAPPPNYTLTIFPPYAGGGTSDPPSGEYTYAEGTLVTVTAIPSSGYELLRWFLDGGDIGATNPIEFTMIHNRVLMLEFVAVSQAGYFRVESTPVGVSFTRRNIEGGPTVSLVTPSVEQPEPGTYEDTMPTSIQIDGRVYPFAFWLDNGSTDPVRTTVWTGTVDVSLMAIYAGILSVDTVGAVGEIFVDGFSWGSGQQSMSLEPGVHRVSFGAVQGYITPQSYDVTVLSGQEAFATGSYTPPGMGTLEVHAFAQGVEVSAQGLIVETSQTFVTPAIIQVAEGPYTVQLTYQGKSTTTTVSVVEGQTTQVNSQIIVTPTPISWKALASFAVVGAGLIYFVSRKKK